MRAAKTDGRASWYLALNGSRGTTRRLAHGGWRDPTTRSRLRQRTGLHMRLIALFVSVTAVATACYGGGEGEDTYDLAKEEVGGWVGWTNDVVTSLSGVNVPIPVGAGANGSGGSGRYRQYAELQWDQSNVTAAASLIDQDSLGSWGSGATFRMDCGLGDSNPVEDRGAIQDLWVNFYGATSRTWMEVGIQYTCGPANGNQYHRRMFSQYWEGGNHLYSYDFGEVSGFDDAWYQIIRYGNRWQPEPPGHYGAGTWYVYWNSGSAPKGTNIQMGLEANDSDNIYVTHAAQRRLLYDDAEDVWANPNWWLRSYDAAEETGTSRMHVARDPNFPDIRNGLHACIRQPADADCH